MPKHHSNNLNQIYSSSAFNITVVLLFTLIISGYFSRLGADPHHDGIMLKPALDLVEGKILFKQSFSQYGALTTLLQAAALAVFGKYLLVIRLLTALFYSFTAIILWSLWSRFISKPLAVFSVIVWILFAPFYEFNFQPWSSVYALFFQVFSSYLTIRFIETKKYSYLLFSGMAVSCAHWARQPVGIFLFISVLAFLFLYTRFTPSKVRFKSIILYYLTGFSIPTLVLLTWIYLSSAISDWWLQSFVFAYKWGQLIGGSLTLIDKLKLIFPLSHNPISIWVVIPLLCLSFITKILILLRLGRPLASAQWAILLICLIYIGSWTQYFPMSDIRHNFWAISIAFGILVYFCDAFAAPFLLSTYNSRPWFHFLAFLLCFMVFVGPDLVHRTKYAAARVLAANPVIQEPPILRGMKNIRSEVDQFSGLYQAMLAARQANPAKNFITTGRDALYLTFFENLPNPHPFYVDWTPMNQFIYPDYTAQMKAYIERQLPYIISPVASYSAATVAYCVNYESRSDKKIYLLAPCPAK